MTSPDHVLLLRSAYRGVGLGLGTGMLRVFGQDGGRRPTWSVVDLVSGERGRSREVVAEDLFGSVPGLWEVTRVEATAVRDRDERVIVSGHILCRPRGVRSFDLCHVPFAHIWTMQGGEALRVVSYLDGIELQRT